MCFTKAWICCDKGTVEDGLFTLAPVRSIVSDGHEKHFARFKKFTNRHRRGCTSLASPGSVKARFQCQDVS